MTVEWQLVSSGWKMFHECSTCNGSHTKRYKHKADQYLGYEISVNKTKKTFKIFRWSVLKGAGKMDDLITVLNELVPA